MAGTRSALGDAAAYGYWRPLLSCSSLPTKVRLLMVQTFIYSAACMARKCDTTKAVKDKMSAVVKKALRSILALHPRDCSSDVLYGDTTSTRCSLMLPNCAGSTDARTWRPMAQEALRFSFEGSRGVGRPKVGTDWCGNVNPLLSRSSTP
jgi:hypothetical protein